MKNGCCIRSWKLWKFCCYSIISLIFVKISIKQNIYHVCVMRLTGRCLINWSNFPWLSETCPTLSDSFGESTEHHYIIGNLCSAWCKTAFIVFFLKRMEIEVTLKEVFILTLFLAHTWYLLLAVRVEKVLNKTQNMPILMQMFGWKVFSQHTEV